MTIEQLLTSYNVVALAPETVLTLFAVLVLIVGAFFPKAERSLPGLALIGTGVTALSTVGLWHKDLVFGPPERAIYVADDFALFFKWIFLAGLAVTVLLSSRFLNVRSGDRHTIAAEYYGLLMFSTVGMMMVAAARDLLVVFLGIETLSIALYVLAGFARARLMSNEAALKYFLLGAFATGFLLYGIALIYYAAHSTLFPEIAANINQPTFGPGEHTVLYAGLALLLIGLGFKAALVPFHQWTPDVYEGSPTPVTAFMAVGAKAAAFAALLRIFPEVFGGPLVAPQWHGIVLVIAVLTMTVGNIIAVSQDTLKRMLAYSSIAHAGYLLMGVVAAGSASRSQNEAAQTAVADAIAATLFYMAVYAVMTLGAFAVLVYLENARQPDEEANLRVGDLRGLAARQPLVAAAMAVFMVSLAGIPPTAGFFGKLFIFQAAVGQGLIGLAIVGALNAVISFYYYARPIVAMYMQEADAIPVAVSGEGIAVGVAESGGLSATVLLAIVVCAVAVLGLVVLQPVVLSWARDAAGAAAGLAAGS